MWVTWIFCKAEGLCVYVWERERKSNRRADGQTASKHTRPVLPCPALVLVALCMWGLAGSLPFSLLPHSTRALWAWAQGSTPQSHCVTVYVLSWPAHRPCQVITSMSYSTLLLAGKTICSVICKSNVLPWSSFQLSEMLMSLTETSHEFCVWFLHMMFLDSWLCFTWFCM